MLKYSIPETMDNPNCSNLKFIKIWKIGTLSQDEFQFWCMMLRSSKTRSNLTSINLEFYLLSECLTVLSLCSECPELEHVDLGYSEADSENEHEAVAQAKREFKQRFGFIRHLNIEKI